VTLDHLRPDRPPGQRVALFEAYCKETCSGTDPSENTTYSQSAARPRRRRALDTRARAGRRTAPLATPPRIVHRHARHFASTTERATSEADTFPASDPTTASAAGRQPMLDQPRSDGHPNRGISSPGRVRRRTPRSRYGVISAITRARHVEPQLWSPPASLRGTRSARGLRESHGSKSPFRLAPCSKVVTRSTSRRPPGHRVRFGFNTRSATAARLASALRPLADEISASINEATSSCLGAVGQPDFEARHPPDVKANYLARRRSSSAYDSPAAWTSTSRLSRSTLTSIAATSGRATGDRRKRDDCRLRPRRHVSRTSEDSSPATTVASRRIPEGCLRVAADSTYCAIRPTFGGHAARSGTCRGLTGHAVWFWLATRAPPTTSRRPDRSQPDSPAGAYLVDMRGAQGLNRTRTPRQP